MSALGYGVAMHVAGFDFWRPITGFAQTRDGCLTTAAMTEGSVAVALVSLAEYDALTKPDLTEAVERAAIAGYEVIRAAIFPNGGGPTWDQCPEIHKHQQREHVLPIVQAVLGVTP